MPLPELIRHYSEMKAALCRRAGSVVKDAIARMSVADFAKGMSPQAWMQFGDAIVSSLARKGILEDVSGLSNRYARSILGRKP